MPFVPHTKKDEETMRKSIGAPSIDALFDEIPSQLKCSGLKQIPEGLTEMAMLQQATSLANNNLPQTCFIGAGSYDHHIPAAVWDITSRGEYLTAYTPYQAEASQGSLQLLYEFQTMIAELTGMDVANASLYDGATALAEAILMAVRINRRSKSKRILIAGALHPLYQKTAETIVCNQHIELISLPFDTSTGTLSLSALEAYENDDVTALVIVQPNFFGCLEAADELCDWATTHNVISIACVNPISLGLITPPGLWGTDGVDIVCGEGQPLGAPMAYGGPYFGFFSTRLKYVRQMPGRLAGRTVDLDGRTGYTLTLQAREQHIRRGKATSNICTNQGLLVTAATVHMSLLGGEGLKQVALTCHQNTNSLVAQLTQIEGVERAFPTPTFHEVVLKLNKPAAAVLDTLSRNGIAGGYAIESHFPELANCILVCATEMRTTDEIAHYAKTLRDVLSTKES